VRTTRQRQKSALTDQRIQKLRRAIAKDQMFAPKASAAAAEYWLDWWIAA